MKQKRVEQTTKELEQHLEKLVKVKAMRLLTETIESKKFTSKWKPILQLLENIHPGSLKKLESIIKESLDKKNSI